MSATLPAVPALELRQLLSGSTTISLYGGLGVQQTVIDLPAGSQGFVGLAAAPVAGLAYVSPGNSNQVIYENYATAGSDLFTISYLDSSGNADSLTVNVTVSGGPEASGSGTGSGTGQASGYGSGGGSSSGGESGSGLGYGSAIGSESGGGEESGGGSGGGSGSGSSGNQAPLAQDAGTFLMMKDEILSDTVAPYASDPEGDTLGFTSTSPGITMNTLGTFIYDPPAGTVGLQELSYTVSDGNGNSVSAKLIIDIMKPSVSISPIKDFSEVIPNGPPNGGADKGYFKVTRVGGKDSSLSVDLDYTGSARKGSDYLGAITSVNFLPNEFEKFVILESVNNQIVDSGDYRTVVCHIVDSDDYTISDRQATINLNDNDGWQWKALNPASGYSFDTSSAPQTILGDGIVTATLNWDASSSGRFTASGGAQSLMPSVRPVVTYDIFGFPQFSWEPYLAEQHVYGNLDYQFDFDRQTGMINSIFGQDAPGAMLDGNLSGGLGAEYVISGRSVMITVSAGGSVTSTVTTGGSLTVGGGVNSETASVTGGLTLVGSTATPNNGSASTSKIVTLLVEQYEW